MEDKYLVRDIRKKGWFTVDNEIIDDGWIAVLEPGTSSVYLLLVRLADKKQESFVVQNSLAKMLGVSTDTIKRALKRLRQHRFIAYKPVESLGGGIRANIYLLLDKSLWSKKPLTDKELYTPGCMDAPTPGVTHAPTLGAPMHPPLMYSCIKNTQEETQEKKAPPVDNSSGGTNPMAEISSFYLTLPEENQSVFRSISSWLFEQDGDFYGTKAKAEKAVANLMKKYPIKAIKDAMRVVNQSAEPSTFLFWQTVKGAEKPQTTSAS